MSRQQLELERELGSFRTEVRSQALHSLHSLLRDGEVACCPEMPMVNLHSHTFFSFNAYDFSPSGLAWEAKKRGLYAVGVVDFDVLDGVTEFLEATRLLGLRRIVGLESRVFVPEWRDKEINSPKEPGVYYFMGAGFTKAGEKGSQAEEVLERMSSLARTRNEQMLGRINNYLVDVKVDYDDEVLPLTPSGNATERHMLVALDAKAREVFQEEERLIRFWSDALQISRDEVKGLLKRPAELQGTIRSKLMKHGGPGYAAPEAGSFPSLDEAIPMVKELGGVPTATWLDGTSEGEQDPEAFLGFFVDKGIGALNIIPDRNWNIQDPAARSSKVKKLHEIVRFAEERHLPILVGTEMNKHGQPFVDDFNAEPMLPVRDAFLRGARIMNGHTLIQEALGLGLMHPEVEDKFQGDWAQRNLFFERVGIRIPGAERDGAEALRRELSKAWEVA